MIVSVLAAISVVHLLNDVMQAVIPAIFPLLKQTLRLNYVELGIISFANNLTASLMQPVVGWYSDKKPMPLLLVAGMMCTMLGMALLAVSGTMAWIVVAVMLVGLGSAIFHPEGSKIVGLSSGSKRGLSQAIFQLGGNTGSALAPLMTVVIFAPLGQFGAMWFVAVAAVAMVMLYTLSKWYRVRLVRARRHEQSIQAIIRTAAQERRVKIAIVLLVLLTFARAWFLAGVSNFYALFQMHEFGASLQNAQAHTFAFLVAGAGGTLLGGWFADHFGKRTMMSVSVLGCGVLSWLLPFVDAASVWSFVLLILTGFCLVMGFPVALLYALELVPNKIGTVSGLMFGLAFGMSALGAVALGALADWVGIRQMMIVCSLLPLLGVLTFLLPSDATLREWNAGRTSCQADDEQIALV